MASGGNPNAHGGGPSENRYASSLPTSPPPTSLPNPQNLSNTTTSATPNWVSALFPLPSASYPPRASGSDPYAFPPQGAASPYHYLPVDPTPPLQPHGQQGPPSQQHNYSFPPSVDAHTRIMSLLSAPVAIQEVPQQTAAIPDQNQTFQNQIDVDVVPKEFSYLLKGLDLSGDELVYDIDVKLPGEVQPHHNDTIISCSDPLLMLERRIALNDAYVCYSPHPPYQEGTIIVRNAHKMTSLIRDNLVQSITDMAFYAKDVHLLASASVDGRVYVWNITEDPDEHQITWDNVIAIQITGEGESVHPRVCWHCHKQEVLAVGIGRHVLRIDTTKVRRMNKFSVEQPLKFSIGKYIVGAQIVGTHDRDVTDLSMCPLRTRWASASLDGTIKIWEDRSPLVQPIAVICPYDGQPVNSVTFLAAPERPDHIILITGGSLNREIKIWASKIEDGGADSWNCTQVLELKSSDARPEEAFFNQVVGLSEAGLLLLANGLRNAIYALHLDYGTSPAATRMVYVSEFSFSTPILSFTACIRLGPNGEPNVHVNCLHTRRIKQHALDLSRWVPSNKEGKPVSLSMDNTSFSSPPLASSPIVSRTLSGFGSPSGSSETGLLANEQSVEPKIVDYSVDRPLDPLNFASVDDDSSINGKKDSSNENGSVEKEVDYSSKDATGNVIKSSNLSAQEQHTPSSKAKKQKGKNAQGSSPSSALSSAFKSTDSEPISSMKEILNQVVIMQKELQKQIPLLVAKEAERIEAALGITMEKAVKAKSDALWVCVQEDGAEREKASREQTLQIGNFNLLMNNLTAIIEKTVENEWARTIPAIENTASTSIRDYFQEGAVDEVFKCLEINPELEAAISRETETLLQSTVKQLLKDTLSAISTDLEKFCQTINENVDAKFSKGMAEGTAASQQQLEETARALRDVINSAPSVTQTLSPELLEGQRKVLALAANTKAANPLISQLSNGPLSGLHQVDVPLDPTKELSRLITERKYEEAFTIALQRSDFSIVSWLCSQVSLSEVLSLNPLPLSQGVLLRLLQQLSNVISTDTSLKLTWMRGVLAALNPTDPHVRPIFEEVSQTLNHQCNTVITSSAELPNIRLFVRVINSMLISAN